MSGRMRKVGRRAATGTVVLAVAAGAVWYVLAGPSPDESGATPGAPVGSAPVTRGTVVDRLALSGTLGYDAAYQVVHQGEPGVLTAAAPAGSTVQRGGVLYAIANQQARLLYGDVPAYRDFATGMPDGPDVRELEANLVALGLDPQHAIVVDAHFSAATAAAIRRWQQSWGWTAAQRTGALPVGAVVFLHGAARVTELQVQPGRAVGPDQPVLAATSTERVVTAQLPVAQQSLVRVGDPVTVAISGLPAFPGTVARIGTVASPPSSSGSGSNQSGSDRLTVPVTITVNLPEQARTLDGAPVQVSVGGESHADVLQVPLIALLAKPGGGYRVRLSSGQYVDVDLGLYDETTGLVEVRGQLTAGQQVEVPAR
jgi:peptidoglycan hydrolase-like protein with peptidoglycan-binding domain